MGRSAESPNCLSQPLPSRFLLECDLPLGYFGLLLSNSSLSLADPLLAKEDHDRGEGKGYAENCEQCLESPGLFFFTSSASEGNTQGMMCGFRRRVSRAAPKVTCQ